MLMRAMAMVTENVDATPSAVRHALAGNLCRCTGYEGIVNAIVQALPVLRGEGARAHGVPHHPVHTVRQTHPIHPLHPVHAESPGDAA
jgi:xanthine dehydrogenase iron-sulfur cluster and FAD-binding subunit A